MKRNFKVVGLDADDTLWINEPYYREKEKEFWNLLSKFKILESEELYKTEMQNLSLYGYGAKGFMLSMIETAIRLSENKITESTISKIIDLGKDLLNKPVILLDGVKDVLDYLHSRGTKLIIATKGDLLDQERKLKKSKIEKYFHHIEIMSDKKESDYLKLLSHLDIKPEDFLMIGNSLKSDIIPIINIGGFGIYVPYHTTWIHEEVEKPDVKSNYVEIENILEIVSFFEG